MGQLSLVLATSVIMATVSLASMLATGSRSKQNGGVVRTSFSIDDDLPEQSYPAF